MMTINNNIQTTAYRYNDDYTVLVIDNGEIYDCVLNKKGYGLYCQMIGFDKEYKTLDEIIELIDEIIEEYIGLYEEECDRW